MTDIHIWKRTLDHAEMVKWKLCKSDLVGDVIDWNKAETIETGDIETEEIDKAQTCDFSKEEQFLAFEQNLDFSQIMKFCNNLGGEVAVANDEETLLKMQRSVEYLRSNNLCDNVVYGGFINKDDSYR